MATVQDSPLFLDADSWLNIFNPDLNTFESCDDVISLNQTLNNILSAVDNKCAQNPTNLDVVQSAVDILISLDANVAKIDSRYSTCTSHLPWKRLLAFYKFYHPLINTITANSIASILNIRAIHAARKLAILLNHMCSSTIDNTISDNDVTGFIISNLHSLIFFCQRISATYSYFQFVLTISNKEDALCILNFTGGFITLYKKQLCEIIPVNDVMDFFVKTNEYFHKAFRPPKVETVVRIEETKGSEEQNRLHSQPSSYVYKRDTIIDYSNFVSAIFQQGISELKASDVISHTPCHGGTVEGLAKLVGAGYMACYEIKNNDSRFHIDE